MDYTVIALIGVMALTAVMSSRFHRRTSSARPGYQYQRVITIGVLGLGLTAAGAIGWDLSHVHGFFEGTRWVDRPIWWQLGLGVALLVAAVFLARRVPPDATHRAVVR